jgi:hypothetical protein
MVLTSKPSIAAVAGDEGDLAGDHQVGGALDAVGQRFATAVEVVELGLGDRVVDVDRRHQQLAGLHHLVEAVHAGGGLLGDAAPLGCDLLPEARALGLGALEQVLDHLLLVIAGGRVDPVVAILHLHALVDQKRRIAAVIDDQLGALHARMREHVERAVPVLLERLALPCEHRDAGGGDRRGGIVLGREDVARGPAHRGTERGQRLDQDRGFLGHVQRAGHAHAFERLQRCVLGADRHQAGHLLLGHADALAAEFGQ